MTQDALSPFEGKLNLLSYHLPYLRQFLREFDVRGKDILEVGGAMPRQVVVDTLGANSWTCTEDPSYAGNQQTGADEAGCDGRYRVHLQNIEDFSSAHDGQYDCIFSIACFEHIAKLPQALRRMHSVLKPGGRIFSMFSPVWSCHDGHHLYHVKVPDRFEHSPETPVLQPWEHLLYTRCELFERLNQRFDLEFAEEVIYETFNSPHVNRYFTEDYLRFLGESPLHFEKCLTTYQVPMSAEYQRALEQACPGYRKFDNMGLYLWGGRAD